MDNLIKKFFRKSPEAIANGDGGDTPVKIQTNTFSVLVWMFGWKTPQAIANGDGDTSPT